MRRVLVAERAEPDGVDAEPAVDVDEDLVAGERDELLMEGTPGLGERPQIGWVAAHARDRSLGVGPELGEVAGSMLPTTVRATAIWMSERAWIASSARRASSGLAM